jgi:tetratricopeptide (TPR) repeat protein
MKYSFCFLILFLVNTALLFASGDEFYTKAMAQRKQENYVEAIKSLHKAIELEPENKLYKKELAEVYYLKKAYFEAIPAYEALVQKESENPLHLARLAEMQSMGSKKGVALELATKAMKMKSNDEEVVACLAKTFFEVKHYTNAIKMYEQLESITPNKNTNSSYKIAKCYVKLDRSIEAVPYFEKSIQDDPTNSYKMLEAANNCYDASNYKRAIELYTMAEEKGLPKSKTLYEQWGNTYNEMKDYNNAIAMYQKGKEYAPLDKELNFNISDAYTAKGDYRKAREILEAMLESNPKDADIIYAIGMTYYTGGNTGKAEKYFNQAFEIKPSLKENRTQKMGM